MDRYSGIIAASFAYIIWGVLPIYWKALQTVPALEILCHRMTWSLFVTLGIILFARRTAEFRHALANRRNLGIFGASALLLAVNWLIYIWAVNAGYILEASLGYFINPLISVVFGVFFFKERLRSGQIAALVLVVAGVLYLTVYYGRFPWIALSLSVTFAIYGLLHKISSLPSMDALGIEVLLFFLRGSVFARSFGGLFSRNPKLDEDLLDEIETALITADVGVGATTALVEALRKRMKAREFADANALLAALRAELIAILRPVAVPLVIDPQAKPFVVLTVGVNGVGKTTTIGKLAKRFKDEGYSLMLAAGDTFRAAAVAQLQAWGERNGVTVVAQGQNADAASVAFDALQAGKARGTQVLIADTAGRLHTQTGLMNELGKIRRVLGKLDPAAPHEVLMVIDGTTGQNALSQLRQFHAAVGVTGLVVTKLDGTAKGGVVFALAREFGIPIRYAGIGERPEDLRVFDAEAFVDALLPEALGSA